MEYIIIAIVLIVVLIILKSIYGISIKRIKELSEKSLLDEIANKLPDDEEVCKQVLEHTNNSKVKVKRSIENNMDNYTKEIIEKYYYKIFSYI